MTEVMVSVMPFAGHVTPFLRAVEVLVDAGDTVRVYTGAAYLDAFEQLGAEVIPWREAPDFDEHRLTDVFPHVGRKGPRGLLADLEHVFIRTGADQAADLIRAFEERPWDVSLTDSLCLGGGLAAERVGTPWATLSVVPLSMPSRDLPPPNMAVAPARGPLGRIRDRALRIVVAAATGRLREAYRTVRGRVGLDPDGRRFADAWFSPFLVMALGVASLEAPRSDLPRHVHFVGAFPPAGSFPLPDWWAAATDSGMPLVHVTQGTYDTDPRTSSGRPSPPSRPGRSRSSQRPAAPRASRCRSRPRRTPAPPGSCRTTPSCRC